MDVTKTNLLGSKLLTVLIVLNSISFFNIKVLNIYDSIALYANLFSLIIILCLRGKIKQEEFKNYSFILIFLIYGFFTLFITEGGIGSIIIPAYSFFLLLTLYNTTLNLKMQKILFITFISLNIYWVLNSPNYYIKANYYNTGQYINSNTIGMVLMYTAIYIKVLAKNLNIRFSNIIIFFIFVVNIYAILNCQSRGALFSLLIFILMDFFIPKKIWKNRLLVTTFIVLIIILGTLFPIIYTSLFNNGYSFNIPFTEKSLYTGREIIWSNFFSIMNDNPFNWLFGIGSKVNLLPGKGKSLNLHNNYLAIITNFGFIGYILYYIFIVKQISKIYKTKRISNLQISMIIGFVTVLINGFVEISTLWHNFLFFNFIFLGMAFNDEVV